MIDMFNKKINKNKNKNNFKLIAGDMKDPVFEKIYLYFLCLILCNLLDHLIEKI